MSDGNLNALLQDPEMKEIVESFIEESREILDNLNSDLIKLENDSKDEELLNKIFRSFHTLKGTSGFLGLDKTTLVTHRCEDILNKLRKGETELNSDLMDVILEAYDKIVLLLASIENNLSEDVEITDIVEKLDATIKSLEDGTFIKESTKSSSKKSTKRTKTPSKKKGQKKSATKEVKITETQGEISPLEKSEVTNEEPEKVSDDKKKEIPSDEKNGQKVENIIKKTNVKGESSIRVDVKRLDDLLNIVTELVLGRNQLQQAYEKILLENENNETTKILGEATKQIDLMTNELQLVVMKTRMVKIGKVFNKYPRLVRDLSRETKKKVNLIINGEDTELDKTLIEEINDPLVHLIRNSIDHGIELPEVRKKAGKDEYGNIWLNAYPEGNNIVITIKDDGKGIDPDIIKNKAVEKGLISKEKADDLSKQDIFNLIFMPGFSTAEKVTNISGRGVGMDVVKTNVKKLRGMINIDSEVGKGTLITIKLPLTLAIISGMVIRSGEEIFVIPLNNILEVLRLHIEDISTIKGKEVANIRDEVIPLISIGQMLRGYKKEVEDVWQYVIVVQVAENKYGIKVDEVIGQKEVVIKSLGSYMGNVPGIAGSTIMGDGSVVMIVDLSELLNNMLEKVDG
jgi:two-component system chemotaxis sensor kinase CheA